MAMSQAGRGRALFVYYRIAAHDRSSVVAAVGDLQARWRQRIADLKATVLERLDSEGRLDGMATLMETYTTPQGMTEAEQAAIERDARADLGRWIVGERHIEVFVPCA
jgi:hypothetical protein